MRRDRMDDSSMPADTLARDWTAELVRREAARVSVGSEKTWRRVAGRIGLATGTVENLVRGRTKALTVTVYERVRAGVVRELEADIARLQHDLQIARASGLDARSAAMGRAEAALAAAREAVAEALK